MGGSIKYPYHTTDGLSEFRGQGGGGSLNWKSKGMGDTYDWNSEGMWGFRSGISTGDRQERIP